MNYISNNYKSQIGYIDNNLYKKYDIIFKNTNNITKHINNYSNDVTNNYKVHEVPNVKKTYYNFTNDAVINKHNTINTDDTYSITKITTYLILLIRITILKRTSIHVLSPITLQDIAITLMNIM